MLPLAFGLVPEGERGRVFDHLVHKITTRATVTSAPGLIGGQWLMRVLTDNGRPDLAYTIATQKTYPSWGYMVEKGATTIWELWNGDTADPAMNSGNHVMLVGDLGIWLYENLAGIKPDPEQPGFKHIIMRPEPVGDRQLRESVASLALRADPQRLARRTGFSVGTSPCPSMPVLRCLSRRKPGKASPRAASLPLTPGACIFCAANKVARCSRSGRASTVSKAASEP